MGWASGSSVGVEIYDKVREYIPADKRKEVANYIYDMLCDLDADAWEGDSDLEKDAELPQYCWECSREIPFGELNEDGVCKKCSETKDMIDK